MNTFIDLIAVYAIGLLGMISHWAKRWKRGETLTSLIEYLTQDPLSTMKAIFMMFGSVSIAVGAGADYKTLLGFMAIVTAGYVSDSGFNKDTGDTRTIEEKVDSVNTEGSTIDTLNISDKKL
jgi:hypothetical protein